MWSSVHDEVSAIVEQREVSSQLTWVVSFFDGVDTESVFKEVGVHNDGKENDG